MVSPYLSLQMFNIGMNYNEIGIITGAVQAISFVATPITGKNVIVCIYTSLPLLHANVN